MKHITLLMFVLGTFCLDAKHTRISIKNAIGQKKIKADLKSLGNHQGYCMNVVVHNLTPDSLVVVIEAGRRLIASNAPDQDILIVKEEMITLRKGQTKTKELMGFCCQASDRCPDLNAKYSVGNLADSALLAIAAFLDKSNYNEDIMQQAVWAISDKRSTSSIPYGKDSCAGDLRKFVAQLKHEPVPWYTIGNCTTVYHNGVIEQVPVFIEGTLRFNNTQECYGVFSIRDTSGLEAGLIKTQWFKVGDNQDYHFKVPVAGLKKGKYKIQIASPTAILSEREFEI